MTLPPERITVKRRRDEEAVDSLCLPAKKYRASALWRLTNDKNKAPAYSGLSIDSLKLSQRLNVQPPLTPEIPTVRTTLRCEDFSPRSPDINSNVRRPIPDRTPFKQLPVVQHIKDGRIAKEPLRGTRKFQLSKNPVLPSSLHLAPNSPAQRLSRSRERALAVFVEERSKVVKNGSDLENKFHQNSSTIEYGGEAERAPADSSPARKRPNATVAEQKWRAENWAKFSCPEEPIRRSQRVSFKDGEDSYGRNDNSLAIAEELQRFALQETKAYEESSGGIKSYTLKIKPKPPKPRQSSAHQIVDNDVEYKSSADELAPEDDDYVIDTYVRTDVQPLKTFNSAIKSKDLSQNLEVSNVGIIIIQDGEEEELWEAFGDPDSDPEGNSEEEDENAEDFYGNDYPEDDISSDDEFGRGAYNHRHRASDDEEFDDDEPAWSDVDQ